MIKLDLSVFIAFWPALSTLVPPLSSRLADSVSRPDGRASFGTNLEISSKKIGTTSSFLVRLSCFTKYEQYSLYSVLEHMIGV